MDYIVEIVASFGQWPVAWKLLGGLVLLMTLDLATGLLAAGAQWRLSSAVGTKGITRKALTLCGVAVGGIMQLILDHLPVTAEFPSALILSTIIGWYIVIELLSIVENFARAGVTLPVITPLAQRFAEAARQSGVIVMETSTSTVTYAHPPAPPVKAEPVEPPQAGEKES